MAHAPPKTPAFTKVLNDVEDINSPNVNHPYTRPETGIVTIRHWIYDLQKNLWLLNEKTIRYENTTIFIKDTKKRKLQEMGLEVQQSWVNILLHLSMAKSQISKSEQTKTKLDLKNLAVVTGMTEVLNDMDPEDAKKIYMQGEKFFLGFGVAQSYETAFKRYEVYFFN
jgi:hypothetical protein